MLHTPLCDLLNIKYPIIQAGMGWDKEGLTTPPALVSRCARLCFLRAIPRLKPGLGRHCP